MEFQVLGISSPSNYWSLYSPWRSFWNMWYDLSQLGWNFPYCVGRVICLKTRSPSRISLGMTLELCLFATLCLADNSWMWVTFLNSSIISVTHSSPSLFTSWLNWEHRNKGVLISTDNIMYSSYAMVNTVSYVVEWGVIWYDQNISWTSSTHKPLVSSSFFLSPFKITLFVESTCPLACGWKININIVWTHNSW